MKKTNVTVYLKDKSSISLTVNQDVFLRFLEFWSSKEQNHTIRFYVEETTGFLGVTKSEVLYFVTNV